MIQGSGTRGNVGTKKAESLPNITGMIGLQKQGQLAPTGAFYNATTRNSLICSAYQNVESIGFSANRSSNIYQDAAPVQPNALLIQCCIKY